MTTTKSITVTRTIGRCDIGDATAADREWQETVREACEEAIELALSDCYPDAEFTVDVGIGAQSSCDARADGQTDDRLTEIVLAASQRGFDAACAG